MKPTRKKDDSSNNSHFPTFKNTIRY